MHNLPIAELRKMLKEHRGRTTAPSKMKKHEILMELEKLGIKKESPASSPEPVVKKEEPKKKEVKKEPIKKTSPVPITDKAEKKEIKERKKEVTSAVAPATENVKKLVKGSQEARDRMAKIRAMRSAKKNVD